MDNVEVKSLKQIRHGFIVTQPTTSKLLVTVPNMNQEITVDIVTFEIIIRAAHSLVGGKSEGLCGKLKLQ